MTTVNTGQRGRRTAAAAPQSATPDAAIEALNRANETLVKLQQEMQEHRAKLAAVEAENAALKSGNAAKPSDPLAGKSRDELIAIATQGTPGEELRERAVIMLLTMPQDVAPKGDPYEQYDEFQLLDMMSDPTRPDHSAIVAAFQSRQSDTVPAPSLGRGRTAADARKCRAYIRAIFGPDAIADTGSISDDHWRLYDAYVARQNGTAQSNGATVSIDRSQGTVGAATLQNLANAGAQTAGITIRSNATPIAQSAAGGAVQPSAEAYRIFDQMSPEACYRMSLVNPANSTRGFKVPGFTWVKESGNPNSGWFYAAAAKLYSMAVANGGSVDTSLPQDVAERMIAAATKRDASRFEHGPTANQRNEGAKQVQWALMVGFSESSLLSSDLSASLSR